MSRTSLIQYGSTCARSASHPHPHTTPGVAGTASAYKRSVSVTADPHQPGTVFVSPGCHVRPWSCNILLPSLEAGGDWRGALVRSFNFLKLIPRQGGLITGTNPAAFTTNDPLRLWIIQVGKPPARSIHPHILTVG